MLASLLRSLVVTALTLLAACGESESPGAPDALPSRSAVAAEVESARSTLDSVDSRDGRLASGPVYDVMPDVPEDAVVVQVVRADRTPAEDVPVLGVEVGRDGRRFRGARLRAGTRTDALGRAVMRKGRQGAVYAAGLFGERPVLSTPDEPFLIELPPCGALHVDLSKFDGRQPLEIRMGASLVRRTPRAPCVDVHRSVPLGETLHIELGRGAAALQVDLRGPTREGEVVSWAPSPPRLLEVRARCVDEEGKPLELERPCLMWRAGDADAAGSDAPTEDDNSGAPPDPAEAFASMHALPLVPDGRGPGYVSGTVAQGDWPTDRGAMLELRPAVLPGPTAYLRAATLEAPIVGDCGALDLGDVVLPWLPLVVGGRVVDASGRSVPNATVDLFRRRTEARSGPEMPTARTWASSEGNFALRAERIDRTGAELYFVQAKGGADSDHGDEVALVPFELGERGLELVLRPQGTLRLEASNLLDAVRGGLVFSVRSPNGLLPPRGLRDLAVGVDHALPPGTYDLAVGYRSGRRVFTIEGVFVPPGGPCNDPRLVDCPSPLKGATLVDRDGRPLTSGVVVYVWSMEAEPGRRIPAATRLVEWSDAEGRFQWFDLGEDYAVFVEADGFERQALADVAEGARVVLERKTVTEQD